eukprot:gene29727-35892_t
MGEKLGEEVAQSIATYIEEVLGGKLGEDPILLVRVLPASW